MKHLYSLAALFLAMFVGISIGCALVEYSIGRFAWFSADLANVAFGIIFGRLSVQYATEAE